MAHGAYTPEIHRTLGEIMLRQDPTMLRKPKSRLQTLGNSINVREQKSTNCARRYRSLGSIAPQTRGGGAWPHRTHYRWVQKREEFPDLVDANRLLEPICLLDCTAPGPHHDQALAWVSHI